MLGDEARVLGTRECRSWLERLTAFENMHFGADFSWTPMSNEVWMSSGAAFYAAVVRGVETYITACMSMLLVTTDSAHALIAGRISECELRPWRPAMREESPILYLASVIASRPAELPFLYGSIASDVLQAIEAGRFTIKRGLAISAGSAGQRHLERNGFRSLAAMYLGRYLFLTISSTTAANPFWQRVLTPDNETFVSESRVGTVVSMDPSQ